MPIDYPRLSRRFVSKLLDQKTRKDLRYAKAMVMYNLGVDYFPGLGNIDRKVYSYVKDIRNGTFVEAGANDGISQSNTWYLERYLGWRGLLIEPVPEIANLCGRYRLSPVENVALGSFSQGGSSIVLHYGALMTVAEGAEESHLVGGDPASHASSGASWVNSSSYEFTCPVAALSTLLEKHALKRIDFFSLDVEGFEVHVLDGIDFTRHYFYLILVETSNIIGVTSALGNLYELVEKLSEHDYLFRCKYSYDEWSRKNNPKN